LDDFDAIEDFAQDSLKVFEKAKEDLAEIEAPEDVEEDFEAYKALVDDQIEGLGDLENAAQAEDTDEISEIGENLQGIAEDAGERADDFGVDECKPESATETTDPVDSTPGSAGPDSTPVLTLPPTLPPETTTETTLAPETTPPPATTVAPVTLPPVTLPPGTAPPATPAPTAAPATDPPNTGPAPVLFDIMDLPARFNAFPPFTLGPPTAEGEANFIQIVADEPILNIAIDEMGVAVIFDETGDAVATIVVGFSINTDLGMPNEWKNMICDPDIAVFHTTRGGTLGVKCDFFDDPDNPLFEVFSATTSEVGLTIATLTPFVTLDELVDGFLAANT
jgi:hypothetical protein